MKYTLTILEAVYQQMLDHAAAGDGKEMAGYLFTAQSESDGEIRYIGREFRRIPVAELLGQSETHLSIPSDSYCKAVQHADKTSQGFWFVHSHPTGFSGFSEQDNREEPALFQMAYVRAACGYHHGSLILPMNNPPIGRVWFEDGTHERLSRIRVIGNRFRFYDQTPTVALDLSPYDRQIRAFGPEIQQALATMHVAIVGAGGTGSSIAEQLIRLGVGEISVFDYDTFEVSNANRVYGSTIGDEGILKTSLVQRTAERIGLGTKINSISESIYYSDVAQKLKTADVIFGCTDEDATRSILGRVALYYAIPVIDMGVMLDSQDGIISSVAGRVTVLLPGAACLYCRGRISAERAAHDMTRFFDPDGADELEEEGYAPELKITNPAVIPFTTSVAAGAVSEFLHRLTGFMGPDRRSTEVIFRFDQNEMGANTIAPNAVCDCSSTQKIGRGDSNPYLGIVLP